MTKADFLTFLSQVVIQDGGQKAFAEKRGISQGLVSMTLSGEREPNDTIANSVGLFRVVRFEATGASR